MGRPRVEVILWYDVYVLIHIDIGVKGEVADDLKRVLDKYGFIYNIRTKKWELPYPSPWGVAELLDELRKYADVEVKRLTL